MCLGESSLREKALFSGIVVRCGGESVELAFDWRGDGAWEREASRGVDAQGSSFKRIVSNPLVCADEHAGVARGLSNPARVGDCSRLVSIPVLNRLDVNAEGTERFGDPFGTDTAIQEDAQG